MDKVYRPKTSYLISEIAGAILLFVVFILATLFLEKWISYLAAAILCIIFVPAFLYFYSATRNHIIMNMESISGKVDRVQFSLNWSSIKMASIQGQGQAKRLVLGTDEGLTTIELKYFDEVDLWKNLKTYMPSEVFTENAYKNLSGYREWKEESTQFINQFADSVLVRYYKFERIFGWTILIISTSLAAYSIFGVNQMFTALMIVCLFLFPGLILIIVSAGKIEADANGICRKTIFGRYAIQWDEIREVLATHNGEVMSLIGDNKHLVLPGIAKWYGEDRVKLSYLVQSKLELADIPVRRSAKPMFSLSKNTRVKS